MERAKIYIFAGLGAVAALAIYGAASTKSAGTDSGHKNRLARIEALMDEGGVKYRPSFFRRHAEPHAKLAGLEPVQTVTEIAAPAAPAAPAKDTKAEDAKKAAEKKAADDKKKKDDEAKKKKKKKKQSAPGDATGTTEQSAPADGDKKPDQEAQSGAGGGGMSSSPISPSNSQDPNKLPETADEWIAYLFTNPSFEKTSKFLQLAQVIAVKPDVFYPVVEKMLSSDVGRMREFGVMCAGNLPNAQSFELLAALANEVTMDDKTKAAAQQYMEKYSQIDYVGYLGTVASLQGDPGAANAAINLIQRSLQRNLVNVASATPSAATSRTPASTITNIYKNLHTSLAALVTTSTDGSVRSNASRTATQIAALLTTIEAQTAAAPLGTVAAATN